MTAAATAGATVILYNISTSVPCCRIILDLYEDFSGKISSHRLPCTRYCAHVPFVTGYYTDVLIPYLGLSCYSWDPLSEADLLDQRCFLQSPFSLPPARQSAFGHRPPVFRLRVDSTHACKRCVRCAPCGNNQPSGWEQERGLAVSILTQS